MYREPVNTTGNEVSQLFVYCLDNNLQTINLVIGTAITTTNIDCKGKAFHCVNTTHFKICVDFGGVSKTVDDFLIPCPPSTVCTDNNYFECEYQIPVTSTAVSIHSDAPNEATNEMVSNDWEVFGVTTFHPVNSNDRKIELTESSTIRTAEIVSEAASETADILNYTPVKDLIETVTDSAHRLQNTTRSDLIEAGNNLISNDLILNDNLTLRTITTADDVKTNDSNLNTNIFSAAVTAGNYPATESVIPIELFNTIQTTPSNTVEGADLSSTTLLKGIDYFNTYSLRTSETNTKNSSKDIELSMGLNEPVKTTPMENIAYKESISSTLHTPIATDNNFSISRLSTGETTYSGTESIIETSTNITEIKSNATSKNETWIDLYNTENAHLSTDIILAASSSTVAYKANENYIVNSTPDTINYNLSFDTESTNSQQSTVSHQDVKSSTTISTIANVSEDSSQNRLEDFLMHKNDINKTLSSSVHAINTTEKETKQYDLHSPVISTSTLTETSTTTSSPHILGLVITAAQQDAKVSNLRKTQANDEALTHSRNIESNVEFLTTTPYFSAIKDNIPIIEIITQKQSMNNLSATTEADNTNDTPQNTTTINVNFSYYLPTTTRANSTNIILKDMNVIDVNASDKLTTATKLTNIDNKLNGTKTIKIKDTDNLPTTIKTDNTKSLSMDINEFQLNGTNKLSITKTNNSNLANEDVIDIDVFTKALKDSDSKLTDLPNTKEATITNNTLRDMNVIEINATDKLNTTTEAANINNTLKDTKMINVNATDNLTAATKADNINNKIKGNIAINVSTIDNLINAFETNNTNKAIKDTKATDVNSTDYLFTTTKADSTNNILKDTNVLYVNATEKLTTSTKAPNITYTVNDTKTINVNVIDSSINGTTTEVDNIDNALKDSNAIDVKGIDYITIANDINNANKTLEDTKVKEVKSTDNLITAIKDNNINSGPKDTIDVNATDNLTLATEAGNTNNELKNSSVTGVRFIDTSIVNKDNGINKSLNDMNATDVNTTGKLSTATEVNNTNIAHNNTIAINVKVISNFTDTIKANNINNTLYNIKVTDANSTDNLPTATNAGSINNTLKDMKVIDVNATDRLTTATEALNISNTLKDTKTTNIITTDNLAATEADYIDIVLEATNDIDVKANEVINTNKITKDTKAIEENSTTNFVVENSKVTNVNYIDHMLTATIVGNINNALNDTKATDINVIASLATASKVDNTNNALKHAIAIDGKVAPSLTNLMEANNTNKTFENEQMKATGANFNFKSIDNISTATKANNTNNTLNDINLAETYATENLTNAIQVDNTTLRNTNVTYVNCIDYLSTASKVDNINNDETLNAATEVDNTNSRLWDPNTDINFNVNLQHVNTLKEMKAIDVNTIDNLITATEANNTNKALYELKAIDENGIDSSTMAIETSESYNVLKGMTPIDVPPINIVLITTNQSHILNDTSLKDFRENVMPLDKADNNISTTELQNYLNANIYSDNITENASNKNNLHSVAAKSSEGYTLIYNNENFTLTNTTLEVNKLNTNNKNNTLTYDTGIIIPENNVNVSSFISLLDIKKQGKNISKVEQEFSNLNIQDKSISNQQIKNATKLLMILSSVTKKPFLIQNVTLEIANIHDTFGDALNITTINTYNTLSKTQVNNTRKAQNNSVDTLINKTGNNVNISSANVEIKENLTTPVLKNETKKGQDSSKMSNVDLNNKNKFSCNNRNRGKYSDDNDCQYFYICIGSQYEPIHGICPNNTVFSEISKQCTKNLSHCIRNNQFQCTSEGRYIDVFSDQFYYICVKKADRYIRFKLKCQKGYSLNKSKLQCILDSLNGFKSNEDGSKIDSARSTAESKSIDSKEQKNDFECNKEGKFVFKDDCRKYYQCKRSRKAEFRRKIKKCDSGEVFNHKKKKCVNEESYECED
ncbi:homeobox-like protein HDP1 [Bicyclus anynana]|uniref:Homeobox-like protein HDP1 n=1 Tax=Bicyclus anynana TaxID=110368 RepID=A0ABM3LGE2_BICAN|nr:homeobox-like protein HDP1 [Bicyclus anynana]